VDQAAEPRLRARLLPAQVEIHLAAGEIADAREAAKELAAVAAHLGAHHLQAAAAQARGAVLLAEGDALAALAALHDALTGWRELDLPYEAARARTLLAACLLAGGDSEAARIEREAAAEALRGLGAAPDLARVTEASRDVPKGPLSRRESEVLRLLATGRTNRTIAAALCISERTVERHVSNIFVKLHVVSRAAATAYAYEHRLL
jgi:DNA-binding NarL/FixJ family response regulator